MNNILKSNKILGLEFLSKKEYSVPEFTFIPDFEIIGVQFSDLNYHDQSKLISNCLNKALQDIGKSEYGYSIRSASFDEDSSDKSSAGRYLSFNGLKTIDELYQAAVTIWQHHRQNTKSGIFCPLIVQKTHCSYYSGVLFKDSSSSDSVTVIESYYGSCRTIVDGMVIPYRSIYSNNKWKHEFKPEKKWHYKFAAHSGLFENSMSITAGSLLHPKFKPFPSQVRQYLDSATNELILYGYRPSSPPDWYFDKICIPLLEAAEKLDLGRGVDIEWGCTNSGDLYFYQFRPLTKSISFINNLTSLENNQEFSELQANSQNAYEQYEGLPASPGISRGYITNKTDSVAKDSILMLEEAMIDDTKAIEECAGVVCSTGGLLSHLAIVCRELKKPCIVGIFDNIPVNFFVEINGNTGIINIIDKS